MTKATIYIVDITAGGSMPPLGWRCAAELARCGSSHVAAALWEGATDSAGPSGPKGRFALTAFPLPIDVSNKYFSVSVEAVIGCFSGGSGSGSHNDQGEVARALQARLHGAPSPASHRRPYGCVFLVDAAQSPEVVAWHLVPQATSLFSAVLVVGAVIEGDGEVATGDVPSDSHTAVAAASRWGEACLRNHFECIPWAAPTAAAAALKLEPVPVNVGRIGLLGGTLTGTARVAQVLANTMWPPSVRLDSRCPSAGKSPAAAVAAGENDDNENVLLVVAGGPSAYLRMVQRRGFQLPGWRFSSSDMDNDDDHDDDHDDEDGDAGAGAQRRDLDISRALGSQDVRFFTVAVPTSSGPRAGEKEGEGEEEDVRPPMLCLVNRYYGAAVRPRMVNAALFDATAIDLLRGHLEALVRGGRPTASLDDKDADGDNDGASCSSSSSSSGVPAVVFWPPSGRSTSDPTSGPPHPPLRAILQELRATEGVDEIVVVTGAAAAFLAAAHNSENNDSSARRGRDGPELSSDHVVESFRSAYAADRLTTVEQHDCDAAGVEVIPLLPVTGIKRRGAQRQQQQGTREAPHSARGDSLVYSRELALEAADNGPLGSDRLREHLHCQAWRGTVSLGRGATHRGSTQAAAAAAAVATINANGCTLVPVGRTAEEEERWTRHLLSDVTNSAAPTAATTTTTAASGEAAAVRLVEWMPQGIGAAAAAVAAVMAAAPSVACAALAVRSKYFNCTVPLRIAGGVAGVLFPTPSNAGSAGPEEVANALSPVTVFITSRALLAACAGSCAVMATDNSHTEEQKGQGRWSDRREQLCAALRAAQQQLARQWASELPGGCADGHGDDGCGELAAVLCIMDLAPGDSVAVEQAQADLRTILFGHAADAETADDASDEERVSFALVELVPCDADCCAPPVTADDSDNDYQGGDGGDAFPWGTTGCARVAEVLTQFPWPEREECIARGVPRPPAEGHGGASGAVSEGQQDTNTPQGSAAAAAAALPVVVNGCELPDDYLVDPLTLRSVRVAALRHFREKHEPLENNEEATQDGDLALEASAAVSGAEGEREFQDDLLAWMDKMKSHGHRLPHAVRQRQAAALALLMEHML